MTATVDAPLLDSGRAAPATTEAPAPTVPLVGRAYRSYALTVLMLIYVLNFLDRQVVAILAEPIKRDLGLADWQLGMMTGLAFAVLYTLLGIPIARFAERANRPLIIAGSVFVWSGFTMVCGMAQNFAQLVAARIGVGVGEAGCTPPALSLIADYTPREKRASAIAFYMLGAPVGGILGMAIGGVIADHWGWRAAFLVVGAPGLLFALISAATLVEPRKRLKAALAAQAEAAPTFRETLRELARKRAYWILISAVTIKAFVSYGATAFMGSFFFRNHGEALAEVGARFGLKSAGFLGIALGIVTGGTAVVGTLLGGRLADHFAAKDARALATIPALGAAISVPFSILGLMSPDMVTAMCILAVPALFNSLWSGPSYAAIQGLVQPRSRATATAILLFVANLIGLGAGPLGVGLVSDIISGGLGLGGAEGVRWSLICWVSLGLPCAGLFWAARRTLREEMVS